MQEVVVVAHGLVYPAGALVGVLFVSSLILYAIYRMKILRRKRPPSEFNPKKTSNQGSSSAKGPLLAGGGQDQSSFGLAVVFIKLAGRTTPPGVSSQINHINVQCMRYPCKIQRLESSQTIRQICAPSLGRSKQTSGAAAMTCTGRVSASPSHAVISQKLSHMTSAHI